METEIIEKKYDDDVVFINRSDYTSEEFLKVNIILSKRFAKIYLILGIFIIICGLLLLACDIYAKDFSSLYSPIIMAVAGLAFVGLFFYIPVGIKKNPNANREMHFEYLFYPDKFVADLKSEAASAKEVKGYNEIKKIYIAGGYIFLYVTKINAYVIKKDVNSNNLINYIKERNTGIKIVK